jgi:hypothetical protein
LCSYRCAAAVGAKEHIADTMLNTISIISVLNGFVGSNLDLSAKTGRFAIKSPSQNENRASFTIYFYINSAYDWGACECLDRGGIINRVLRVKYIEAPKICKQPYHSTLLFAEDEVEVSRCGTPERCLEISQGYVAPDLGGCCT